MEAVFIVASVFTVLVLIVKYLEKQRQQEMYSAARKASEKYAKRELKNV